MNPIGLDSLFKQRLFRIPDYQRGYAWQKLQLKDFWEDLINLNSNRSHYTGVVTMKEVPSELIKKEDCEYWLIDEHSYKMYEIIDGQQRLTTCVIFIQSLIDFIKSLDENKGKNDNEIFLTETLNIKEVIEKYLYKQIPTGSKFKTYKFGYNSDNPSYQYMKYKILGEENPGRIDETFYTLNLGNAKIFFYEQLKGLYLTDGLIGIQEVYKKLTKNFLFNEYIIKDEFDVFVAFETMNNRGKNLSKLELLKNRLIYLTTLFPDKKLDPASRNILRNEINDAWKEVYYQLGRNEKKPLIDDDFLKAHWIISFKYTRSEGDAYIKYLLDEKFSPKKIYKKFEKEINIEVPIEQNTDFGIEDNDNDDIGNDTSIEEKFNNKDENDLSPEDIKNYVSSLKSFALHWYNSHYPYLAIELSSIEKEYIDKLNRIGMGYFRPLVVSILKNINTVEQRVELFKKIERFIFISIKLSRALSNYGDTEFYNASRELDKGIISLEDLHKKITEREKFNYNEDGTYKVKFFHDYMYKKFTIGNKGGYYNWNGLQYFLYEYELEKMKETGQKKVDWELFIKNDKDKLSIEHILPQTLTSYWKEYFKDMDDNIVNEYNGSLGNLLLLSQSINSSLQNGTYEEKKSGKRNDSGDKIRIGYTDGSHSEIEVSQLYKEWTPNAIYTRGGKLLDFMEKRWDIKISNEGKNELLFVDPY